jgi:hypothetical protein
MEFLFGYQFSFLKWRLINPSRPPFFKGRRAFLKAFDKRFFFSPGGVAASLLYRGDEGGFEGFSKS